MNIYKYKFNYKGIKPGMIIRRFFQNKNLLNSYNYYKQI